MKQILFVIPIILILMAVCAGAESIQLNASQSATPDYSPDGYGNHWVANSGYDETKLSDENWATYSYPVGFYTAAVSYNYDVSSYGAITGAFAALETGDHHYYNLTLPSACYNQNNIQMTYTLGSFSLAVYCNESGTNTLIHTYSGLDANWLFEQSLNIETALPTCNLGCPSSNCIFFDNMNYTSPFESCGYQIEPQFQNLTPAYNYFFSPVTSDLQHPYLQPAAFYPKVSDKFHLNFIATAGNSGLCNFLEQSGFLEHQLIYQSGLNSVPAYDITFYYDTSSHQVSIYSLMPGNYLETIAANALNPYYDTAIEIDSYYYQTPTEKFYNTTSSQWQYFNANSYSIYIDGTPIAYNVPMPNNFTAGNSYIPKTFDYYASNCVLFGNLDIAGNSGFNQQNQTTLKQNNDFCNSDADCISDYCIYGKCSGKSGGADCAFNEQCLSGACNSGKCSNPGAWNTIDSGVKSLFGSGTLDLSLISILIILLIGGALILITKGAIAGIVAALGISLILLFFFTFAGWLAPFIFVACILFILLGVLLFFIISQRGN